MSDMDDYLRISARAFAIAAHTAIGQKRKYTGEPYWHHANNVATLVSRVTNNIEVYCAAWLHDVVEDTHVTIDDIFSEFGDSIGKLVSEVTDISKPTDGNRAERKRIDREHLARASSYGQTIKLADLIDNTRSIVARDPDFAKVYMREKRELLSVLTKGETTLYREASELVNRYFAERAELPK